MFSVRSGVRPVLRIWWRSPRSMSTSAPAFNRRGVRFTLAASFFRLKAGSLERVPAAVTPTHSGDLRPLPYASDFDHVN